MTPTPKDVLRILQDLPAAQARVLLAETLAVLDEREHAALRRQLPAGASALARVSKESPEPAAPREPPTLVSKFPKPWEIEDAQLIPDLSTAERAFFAASPEPEPSETLTRAPTGGRRPTLWLWGLGGACLGLIAGVAVFSGKPFAPTASATVGTPPPSAPPVATPARADLPDLPPLVSTPAPARPTRRRPHPPAGHRRANPDDAFATRF